MYPKSFALFLKLHSVPFPTPPPRTLFCSILNFTSMGKPNPSDLYHHVAENKADASRAGEKQCVLSLLVDSHTQEVCIS